MALTKVIGSGVEGITNLSNATFLSVASNEVATLLTTAVVTSEGGAATSIISQGLAKLWANLQGVDTFGLTDSFNVTSATDHGTGDHTITMANDFAGVGQKSITLTVWNTADASSSNAATNAKGGCVANQLGGVGQQAGATRIATWVGSSSSADGVAGDLSAVYLTGQGDLA